MNTELLAAIDQKQKKQTKKLTNEQTDKQRQKQKPKITQIP